MKKIKNKKNYKSWIAFALLSAMVITGVVSPVSYAKQGDFIVVTLDPGHDATHKGAYRDPYTEEGLNQKIAQYCKEELEKYCGVKVYMSHNDLNCPYPGTSAGDCNKKRVETAAAVASDIYVSLHLNTFSDANASGVEIYYPNGNYRPEVGLAGNYVAGCILGKLTALGLHNRGLKTRPADTYKYPDNSVADYYGVIRNSKLLNMPGIIVEHAFMSSPSDVANFLNEDWKLKNLGIADASGIAQAYNLARKHEMYLDNQGIWHASCWGQEDKTYTGIAYNGFGGWYFANGVLDFNYQGFGNDGALDWYVQGGKVQDTYTGLANCQNGYYYIQDGRWNKNYTGYACNENGWWWLDNGMVNFGKTGVVCSSGIYRYVRNGQVDFGFTGMAEDANKGWMYFEKGEYKPNYTGMACNEYGWWYFTNGKVNWNYTGYATNNYGTWWYENGQIAWNKTGMICLDGTWRYVRNGQVDFGYTGMACNEYGWWYFSNGELNWNYTGMACNDYGWWYFENGRINFGYTGYACNQYGFWWYENGQIARNKTGMVYGWDIWRYVRNGQVDFGYTGMACNEYGWWYFSNGELNWNYTGMALNEYGWWYYQNGRLDWNYTGYGYNEYGRWWYENGRLIGPA